MNLHDFVIESFNPEHIFRDAHTVPFCLTADHISTYLMMFSARFKTAQFWSVLDYVVNGSVISVLISDVGMSGAEHSIHGVPWRALVRRPVNTLMEYHGELWCGDLSATMEYHGELGVGTCQHSHGVP